MRTHGVVAAPHIVVLLVRGPYHMYRYPVWVAVVPHIKCTTGHEKEYALFRSSKRVPLRMYHGKLIAGLLRVAVHPVIIQHRPPRYSRFLALLGGFAIKLYHSLIIRNNKAAPLLFGGHRLTGARPADGRI